MRRLTAATLCGALLALPTTSHAAAPNPCPGNHGTPTYTETGTFSSDEEGRYVLVPFEVGAGATKVRVKLCYDQPEAPTSSQIKHTLDLGIYDDVQTDGFHDEEEFRGWGGSSRLNAFVSPDAATLGFKPGAIEAGEWAGEIGVAAVASQTEGDLTGEVDWRMEIFVTNAAADADDPWEPTPYQDIVVDEDDEESEWYKGDFHVHAEHSSPSDATMEETFEYAFTPRSEGGAGLDFITLSDYVTDRHWDEIGRYQGAYPNNVIMRSAEIITYRGHINNHDSHTYVDYRTGEIYELRDDVQVKVRDAQPASRIFDDIHAEGGFTQVNHPTTFPSTVPGFDNLCRGCSWEYSDEETDWSKVDAMEVQTGPSGLPEPEGNEPGPNPFTPLAIEWWDRLNAQGFDITGVGSSDSHHADRETPTQSPIGEATTVIYAPELSEDSIHEAILAGHAYVKFFHSGGPDLRLSATASETGETAIMGDELVTESAEFTAQVLGGAPSPQVRSLIVLRDGQPLFARPVTSDDFTFNFIASRPGDYRLQLERGSAIEALTNPINLSDDDPPPPPESPPQDTTLAFTERSASRGQYTDSALVEARLEDESGDPVEGATVDFRLTGSEDEVTWSEQTDAQGLAFREVPLDMVPGDYLLTAQYDGSDSHNPSADSQDFRIRREDSETNLRLDEKHARYYLFARLTEKDTPSHALVGRPIRFFVDGESIGVRWTKDDGVARHRIPKRYTTSGHTLEAKFPAGKRYKKSSDALHISGQSG